MSALPTKAQRRGSSGPERRRRPSGRALELSYVVAIMAAVVLAVMVNILAARHYRRWDWTSVELYTLSPPTVETLTSLGEPLHIYVLLSSADPHRTFIDLRSCIANSRCPY